ncbi:cell filamentation protein Fic [Candidatus Peregrinibacteria bacterium]|nr:MAG: cell filamentation protein Fic [Candidatus Peregrinibacteria bacterium]
MTKPLSFLKKIQTLRKRYYLVSSKKQALLKLIHENEVSEQVYDSNAIENSTLTLEDTEKILLEIQLDRGISERELFEAKNLARVVSYIEKKAIEEEISLPIILFLHKMLLSNIHDDVAGRLRNESEWVRVSNHIAPDPKHIPSMIESLLIQYLSTHHENIVKRIALFHLTFEHIHPFVDGNGRIGRIINNYLLIREGFVPINIKFIDRKLYYEAFNEFDTKKETKIMEAIVGKSLTNSYHKRLAYLEGKEIITLSEYAKKEKTSHSNLINKAHRQTIEAFLEKGIWKIGI